MKQIENYQSELFEKIRQQQGMRNIIFGIETVVEGPEDTWVFFEQEPELDQYENLH